MALPTRNISSYTLPTLNVGYLLLENGDALLQENGYFIVLENPTYNPNLTTRNSSSYSLPARN